MAHTQLAIVGGGIAGLSAAWYAQQQGIDYVLLESSDRWGGKIRTETLETDAGTILIETGPDSFITQKPWALKLARELGLGDEVLNTNEARSGVKVLVDGKMRNLPDGLMLIIPTKFMPFALSNLISPLGKLRMAFESLIPARKDNEDESLADFVRRRLGTEALDKLAEPLMSGIYNTDAEAQSLLATFPRFRTIEQKYGSLTRGMIAAKAQRPPASANKTTTFVSFRNGMQTMVDEIERQLDGDLRLNTSLTCIDEMGGEYLLSLSDGTTIQAQQVLLALPAYAMANVLEVIAPHTAQQLQQIEYVNTGTINLVYRRKDVPKPLDGFGVVIPSSENRNINAITVSSNKFDYRAPLDLILMRVFFGGARTPHTYALDDDALVQSVRDELQDLLDITAEPVVARVVRNVQATPQYRVGHLDDVASIESDLPDGIHVTGSAFYGVGVPDCVHQAEQVVSNIMSEMRAYA